MMAELSKFNLFPFIALGAIAMTSDVSALRAETTLQQQIKQDVAAQIPELYTIYTNLHAHPELSLHEEKTSAFVASQLQALGYETTTRVGGYGVVGVLRNGDGPKLLIRTDMDALPVKEQTKLPYASTVVAKDDAGRDVSVMHACGHDIHMTSFIGTARLLARYTNQWHGTLVMLGQPAEERGGGAKMMIDDGLFQRFPKPDFCLALHDSSETPAGMISFTPGFSAANVDSVEITVRGVGGHGAYPQRTKDPVVLAAQIILELQTIVSRETRPGDACVVTVGSIHGGTKNNIIPDDVKLQLTVRSYADEVRHHALEAINRIARGCAIAAGMPDNLMPIVKYSEDYTPALYNDPALGARVVKVLNDCFGETNIVSKPPGTGGEDFSRYGRTEDKIPICMFNVGAVATNTYAESIRNHTQLPSLHSSLFAPDPKPTLQTAITAMTASALDLLAKK